MEEEKGWMDVDVIGCWWFVMDEEEEDEERLY